MRGRLRAAAVAKGAQGAAPAASLTVPHGSGSSECRHATAAPSRLHARHPKSMPATVVLWMRTTTLPILQMTVAMAHPSWDRTSFVFKENFMQPKISHLAGALVAGVAALASASSMACTIAPANPMRIKQMMANEIAHRLGMRPQQIPLNAISQPQLHTPLGLGADCSGLGAYHYSAGFRIGQQTGPQPWPGPGPGPWPGPGPGPGPGPWPGPGADPDPDHLPPPGPGAGPGRPWPDRRPGRCAYEGVAVVLGYSYSSPVAVHFERRCR